MLTQSASSTHCTGSLSFDERQAVVDELLVNPAAAQAWRLAREMPAGAATQVDVSGELDVDVDCRHGPDGGGPGLAGHVVAAGGRASLPQRGDEDDCAGPAAPCSRARNRFSAGPPWKARGTASGCSPWT